MATVHVGGSLLHMHCHAEIFSTSPKRTVRMQMFESVTLGIILWALIWLSPPENTVSVSAMFFSAWSYNMLHSTLNCWYIKNHAVVTDESSCCMGGSGWTWDGHFKQKYYLKITRIRNTLLMPGENCLNEELFDRPQMYTIRALLFFKEHTVSLEKEFNLK